jgi:hypothetical protein
MSARVVRRWAEVTYAHVEIPVLVLVQLGFACTTDAIAIIFISQASTRASSSSSFSTLASSHDCASLVWETSALHVHHTCC